MAKRKRRREAEMFSMMEHYEESGLTQREFCIEVDLPQSVFQYWWRRYRESQGERPYLGANGDASHAKD